MNERIIPTDSIRSDESKVFHLTNTNVLSNVTKLLELQRRPRVGGAALGFPDVVAGVSLETRKLLLGHKNGDITTHYSAAEIGELVAASNRISAAKATPSITLLRASNG